MYEESHFPKMDMHYHLFVKNGPEQAMQLSRPLFNKKTPFDYDSGKNNLYVNELE